MWGLHLRPPASPHAAALPHPHAVSDLDFDLIVVHHFGHLSDQPARGDEDVAAAHILHHLLVLLCPLLLGPQDEEIHDDENKGKRQQLIKDVRADASHALCVGGCDHARNSPLRVLIIQWFARPGNPAKNGSLAEAARAITAAGPIATVQGAAWTC